MIKFKLPDFRTYYEAPIIMTLAYSRQIDQWNRTEQPKQTHMPSDTDFPVKAPTKR